MQCVKLLSDFRDETNRGSSNALRLCILCIPWVLILLSDFYPFVALRWQFDDDDDDDDDDTEWPNKK